jgi:DNA-binding PadR family transcriptional regulator
VSCTSFPSRQELDEHRAGAIILTGEKRVVEGRQRRTYTLTPAGKAALAETRARLAELVAEVLETPA